MVSRFYSHALLFQHCFDVTTHLDSFSIVRMCHNLQFKRQLYCKITEKIIVINVIITTDIRKLRECGRFLLFKITQL